ncbi:MAG: pyridoxine/pyridoxamine 5'-phosphate oxidase [Microbacteriaceae bacterium]
MSDSTAAPRPESLRDRLRALAVVGTEQSRDLPDLDPDVAPADPLELLQTWLEAALAANVSQPHAMTLATADSRGIPNARIVLLKDLTPEGLWFASLSSGPKGRELESGHASVVFYWREQARQIRVSGEVRRGPRDIARADFLQRHPKARATVIAGTQSEPIGSDHDALQEAARARVEREPRFVPEEWTAYVLTPRVVEFWQAAPRREQTRVSYERVDGAWTHALLWP